MILGEQTMKIFSIVIIVILIGIGTLVFAEKTTKKKSTENYQLISKMGTLSAEERMSFLNQLTKERLDIQGNLIQLLKNSRSKDVKFAAAFLIGLYRMERSVYSLSRYITLESESEYEYTDSSNKLPLWDRYPIVQALIRIGKPAVPEMIRNIQTSDDEKVRQLSARVIRYVEGPEFGRIVIEKAIERQTDPQKKSKLEAALSLDYFKLVEEK
jgi:HEAT repeat protein